MIKIPAASNRVENVSAKNTMPPTAAMTGTDSLRTAAPVAVWNVRAGYQIV